MLRLLALSLVFISLSSLASDRNVWDLQYMPVPKTFFGESTYSVLDGELEAFDKTNISGWVYSQTAGYSFAKNVLVSVTAMNSHLKRDIQFNGWHDPSLDGRYRMLDEDFRVDILAGGSFGLGTAQSGRSGANNNNMGPNDFLNRGGPRLYLGVEAGQKLEDLQYAFLLQADHVLEQDYRSQGSALETYDNHTNFTFQSSLLNMLLKDKVYLRSFAAVRFLEKHDISKKGSELNSFPSGTDYRLGTGFDYAVTNDLLVQLGGYFRELQINTGTIEDYHFWVWNLGARYQY